MKKILSLLLCVMIITNVAIMPVFAEIATTTVEGESEQSVAGTAEASTLIAIEQDNELNRICLTSLPRISWDRYTGNQGDSRLNVLGEDREYGYGNESIEGGVYENGFEAWIARWNYTPEISWVTATYDLNGEYNTLTGNTGLIQSYNTTNFDTTVYFYDNDRLLASYKLTDTDYKKEIDVNVSGVKELRVLVQDNIAVSGGTSLALYDMFLDGSSQSSVIPTVPVDASEYNNHFYKVYTIETSWSDAKDYCESVGGHLATITSQGEQDFISTLLTDELTFESYWLGGYKDSKWTWITGETFEYTNWARNEPNGGDCLQIYSYARQMKEYMFWDDTWNEGDRGGGIREQGFICEWDDFNNSLDITIPEGLNIFANNLSQTYVEGDIIIYAVTQTVNGTSTIPADLAVAISNTSIATVLNIYNYNDILNGKYYASSNFPDELKTCAFILIQAEAEGMTGISITNTATGECQELLVTVSKDNYANIRVDTPPVRYDEFGEAYNYIVNGMVISDFRCDKASGGYNYTMSIYNQNYSLGVVEVYNAQGKLIQVEKIEKFAPADNIIGTFVEGWHLLEDAWDATLLSFNGQQIAKETPINIFVPQDGFVRITNDSAVSTTCFVLNLFNAILTSGDIISGLSSLSASQLDAVDKAVLKEFAFNSFYLNYAKSCQEKMEKLVAEETTEAAVVSLVSQAGGIAEGLLVNIDISLEDLLKSALGTAYGTAENIFTKVTGSYGLALNAMMSSRRVMNYATQLKDWVITTNKKVNFSFMTPYTQDSQYDQLVSPDGITIETYDTVPTETVSNTFRILKDDTITIELQSGKILNDYVLYDISMMVGGEEIQPNGTVMVTVPVPQGFGDNIVVERQGENGSWETLEAKVENGLISFYVNHFCVFAIVERKVLGDANDDGVLSTSDARYILQSAVGLIELTDEQMPLADMNGDGKVNSTDGRRLLLTIVGETREGVMWSLNNGTLTISGQGDMDDYTSSVNAPWFDQKDTITKVVIEDGVTKIGNYAFYDCTKLTDVTIPDSVTMIGFCAFEDCESLESVVIPNSVTKMMNYAFAGCESLSDIKLSNKLTGINDWMFWNCDSLESITIPDSATAIGDDAFLSCRSLANVTFSNNLKSIGSCAFSHCSALQSINLPSSVTDIEYWAFAHCTVLENVLIPNSVTNIDERAFFCCDSLKAIDVDEVNATYCDIDGVLFTKDGKVLVQYPAGKTATEYAIPDGVTQIGLAAFFDCKVLKTISISQSVAEIGSLAFDDCFALKTFDVSEQNTVYCDIDGVLFTKDRQRLVKYPDGNIATEYVIPDGVVYIGEDSFRDNDYLQCVTIPMSVTVIEKHAFEYVPEGKRLTDVYYKGSESDWAAISIDEFNELLYWATIHYAITE